MGDGIARMDGGANGKKAEKESRWGVQGAAPERIWRYPQRVHHQQSTFDHAGIIGEVQRRISRRGQ
jgi:hypothetical protein